jgi:hypothetical protein
VRQSCHTVPSRPQLTNSSHSRGTATALCARMEGEVEASCSGREEHPQHADLLGHGWGRLRAFVPMPDGSCKLLPLQGRVAEDNVGPHSAQGSPAEGPAALSRVVAAHGDDVPRPPPSGETSAAARGCGCSRTCLGACMHHRLTCIKRQHPPTPCNRCTLRGAAAGHAPRAAAVGLPAGPMVLM